jgi:glycosyltransferase involved in cell wall biosynthesis
MSSDVAVIVIAYNEERRIGPCLDALLSQSTSIEYEVIVIDDGSSDATAQIVEQRQSRQSNLRLLSHATNRGRGAARRTGQDASDTPWIAFVDADIVVPPDWLQRCMEEISIASGVSGIAQATLRERTGSAEITGNNLLLSRDVLNRFPFSPRARLGEDFRLAKLMKENGIELRTVRELKVAHRESKTYWQGIAWMWKSGVDATSLLFEFGVIRLPDIAWATWLAGLIASVVSGVSGVLSSVEAVTLVVALTLIVDVAFIFSRFKPYPHPMRFLGALALSPTLMLAYLGGRSAGLPLVPLRRRHSV